MANWTGVITNAGNDVLSEWVNENTLNFDSAAAGQGTVATAGMLAQTALVNRKQTASIIGADRVSTGIRLKIRITAPQTAYTLNQYGVWASVTGGSSTMIALFQHEDGIPIPSATESPDFVYTFYALISVSNTGEWTVNIDTAALVTLDDMETAIATAVATKEGLIKDADAKNSIADADAVAVVDSADGSKTKRVLWSTIKSALGQIFVPLTRKINNKALSADITLTGDDIKTSATDETTVSSQLSNTALSTLGQVTDSNLLTWADAQPHTGAFGVNPAVTTEGVPAVGWYHGSLEVKASGRRLILTESSGQYRTWTNCTNSNQWTKWKPLALATPPQEFDLPLAEGTSAISGYKNAYRKDQFGIVRVWFSIRFESMPEKASSIFALPEGFRPDSISCASTILSMNEHYTAAVAVHPSGVATVDHGTIGQTGPINLHGFIEFPAAG